MRMEMVVAGVAGALPSLTAQGGKQTVSEVVLAQKAGVMLLLYMYVQTENINQDQQAALCSGREFTFIVLESSSFLEWLVAGTDYGEKMHGFFKYRAGSSLLSTNNSLSTS
ncbi:hypothetical protein B0J12DRAFT_698659 [Macrophomina phaseolina]|uniref:Uncharacterized protein n=1 Tax=Macrophomina phaseolina TaxID=35725 RepID=A0ABQ8GHU0_9PEZI|nr:hypothetical protein B0J12DRAFT_698659 [Macrophomina phaseolina]